MIDILMHSIKIYNTIGKESIITKTKDLNIHKRGSKKNK